jgi:hypothetical protein
MRQHAEQGDSIDQLAGWGIEVRRQPARCLGVVVGNTGIDDGGPRPAATRLRRPSRHEPSLRVSAKT